MQPHRLLVVEMPIVYILSLYMRGFSVGTSVLPTVEKQDLVTCYL